MIIAEPVEAGLMRFVDMSEAKAHFSRLLQDVAEGDIVVIPRQGVPVAQLGPPDSLGRRSLAKAVQALLEFQEREHITLGGLSLCEMIEEGRR